MNGSEQYNSPSTHLRVREGVQCCPLLHNVPATAIAISALIAFYRTLQSCIVTFQPQKKVYSYDHHII